MLADLFANAARCLEFVGQDGGTLLGLFLAGLVGSVTHCVGMCGPFVLSQTSAKLSRVPLDHMTEFRRLRAASLLPYHMGRITTYSGLGALMSLPVGMAVYLGDLWWLPPAMLVAAALAFLGFAFRLKGMDFAFYPASKYGAHLSRIAAPLFLQPTLWRGYLLGIVLGFLPCGLVYAAIAAAAASGDLATALLRMWAFGLGTVPALFGIAYGGDWLFRRFGFDRRQLAPAIAIANAAFLILVAYRLVLEA